MTATLPFFTAYDPAATSEGNLDPVGLYQIADQLAVRLVPAVRERMQRIRFLTAIAVGTRVLDGLDEPDDVRDASPYLVWEWHVVQALIRASDQVPLASAVAGSQVVKRAIDNHGYVDANSYLKTPRVFGFHGVYKRLANHLKLIDVHQQPKDGAEALIGAWAAGLSATSGESADALIAHWAAAVKRGIDRRPPRTHPNWSQNDWIQLAEALNPGAIPAKEKRLIREMLLVTGDGQLGAFGSIWNLLKQGNGDEIDEPAIHKALKESAPAYRQLLTAIGAYEAFARTMQDAFDSMRTMASTGNAFRLAQLTESTEFTKLAASVPKAYAKASEALEQGSDDNGLQHALFQERFSAFAEPLGATDFGAALCAHHEAIQKRKSAGGKRTWFDPCGHQQIFLRKSYYLTDWEPRPGHYVHEYRTRPIARFLSDLT